MRKFNYQIDFSKARLNEVERAHLDKLDQKQLFEMYFGEALSKKTGGAGLKAPEGRAFVRILNKLDLTTEPEIVLEEAEFELMKGAFCNSEACWQPNQYKILVQYLSKFE